MPRAKGQLKPQQYYHRYEANKPVSKMIDDDDSPAASWWWLFFLKHPFIHRNLIWRERVPDNSGFLLLREEHNNAFL